MTDGGDELLTESEQGFFQRMGALFESAEWRQLHNEWRKEINDIPLRAFQTAQSWDEILAARAMVRKLEEMLAAPIEYELRRQALVSEREQLAEDMQESEYPDV